MKHPIVTAIAFGLLLSFFISSELRAGVADKVVITAQAKREKGKLVNKGPDTNASQKDKVTYAVTVKNAGFGPLPAISVDYILFVERQKVGERITRDPDVQRVQGTIAVDGLKSQASALVATDPIILATQNLVGGWSFNNGGRIRAVDSVVGIWIRAMKDGKVIGEYANPTTVVQRGWEKK